MNPQPLELQPGPAPATSAKLKRGEVIRIVLIGAFIVASLILLYATPLGHKISFSNMRGIQQWLTQWGAWAWAVFLVLGTVLLSFGFPRMLFSAIAGVMFGVFKGTLLAEVVTTVSAILPFYYTMYLGREIVERRLGGRLQRFNALLAHHGFKVILLIRICPVGYAFLTNCLAGLSAIRFRSYMLASALGFLPMTFFCAWLGEALASHSLAKTLLSGGMLVACSLLFGWYFRRSTLARDVMEVMRDGK